MTEEMKYYTDGTSIIRRKGGLFNSESPVEIWHPTGWEAYEYAENIFVIYREVSPERARQIIAKYVSI